MTDKTMTLDELRQAGLEALARELGPVGMVRFLQMFETGKGVTTRLNDITGSLKRPTRLQSRRGWKTETHKERAGEPVDFVIPPLLYFRGRSRVS